MTAAVVVLAVALAGAVGLIGWLVHALVKAIRRGAETEIAKHNAEVLAADTARAFASYKGATRRKDEAQDATITRLEKSLREALRTGGDVRAAVAEHVRVLRAQATDRDAADRAAAVLAEAAAARAAGGDGAAVPPRRGLLGRLFGAGDLPVARPRAGVDGGSGDGLPGGDGVAGE